MPNIGKLRFIKQKLIDLKGEINRTLIPNSQQWIDHLDRELVTVNLNKTSPSEPNRHIQMFYWTIEYTSFFYMIF